MKIHRRFMLACLFVGVWSPGVWAERGAELYEIARSSYHRLNAEEQTPDAGAWNTVARQFGVIPRVAPRSARADDALYMAGLCRERAYASSSDDRHRTSALDAYHELASEYPGSNLADDALLRGGRIRELQGRLGEARVLYEKVLSEHSTADMAPLARKRLRRLGLEARVAEIRSWSTPEYTRIVVDLDHLAPFQANVLPANPGARKPPRIYLDLANARISGSCPSCTAVGDGLVRQVRVAQFDPKTVRVVLDLAARANYRVFPLEAPARIVIDVSRAPDHSDDLVAALITGHRRGEPTDPEEGRPGGPTEDAASRPLRIVLDPGHGGKDPGAVGPGGLYEKDVVLAVSKQLARALKERLHCEVKLTRNDDRFLPLEQRTAIANGFGADLFISIHANASRSRKARGIETYYLDRTSDRAARRMAARENDSTEAGLAEIEHILTDVLLSSKIRESRRLAEAVQQTLVDSVAQTYGPVRNLGVKRGPFYVLTGAMMPAILIETSFITHPTESRRLASSAFRRHAARAMAAGVAEFAEGS